MGRKPSPTGSLTIGMTPISLASFSPVSVSRLRKRAQLAPLVLAGRFDLAGIGAGDGVVGVGRVRRFQIQHDALAQGGRSCSRHSVSRVSRKCWTLLTAIPTAARAALISSAPFM